MDVSSRSSRGRWTVFARAGLAGAALGVVMLAGASLVLYDASGLLSGSAGLAATLIVALAVGIWAGGPDTREEELPLRERWVAAALATGVAGAFATFWTLYGVRGAGPLARVAALLFLIAIPAYFVGLLLPLLFTWSDRQEGDTEEGGHWAPYGRVALGVLGGLAVGAVAAGIFLVPRITPGPLLLAVSIALLAPLVFPDPEAPAAEETLLYATESPFGTLQVTEVVYPGERQPERRLYLNEEEESGEQVRSGAPTLAYIAAAESWLAGVTPLGSSYLFLGGGAYTLPRRVAERDPRARVTVVELDPEVTRLAYRFFGLRREHGIASVHGDARAFLEQEGAGEVDRLYMDVYGGGETLPYALVTREAFALARRHLRPDGLLAINLIGVTAGAESRRFWSVVRTLCEVFPGTALYTHQGPDFPERQNVLLAASADSTRDFPAHAGLFDLWPREQWPDLQGTVVFRDLFPIPERDASHEPRGELPARSS